MGIFEALILLVIIYVALFFLYEKFIIPHLNGSPKETLTKVSRLLFALSCGFVIWTVVSIVYRIVLVVIQN